MFNDNYDDELEPDYTAPAPTNRIQTVSQLDNRDLQLGDKLTCLDDSWLHIFMEYRSMGSCITTLYVAEVLPDFQYRIGITDIVQEQGSLKVPAGITTVVPLDVIREAIKASEALRAAPLPVKKPFQPPLETLVYERLINKLKTTAKVYVGVPKTVIMKTSGNAFVQALKDEGCA